MWGTKCGPFYNYLDGTLWQACMLKRLHDSLRTGVVGGVSGDAGIDISLERYVGYMQKASNFS
jgi:hypothetical protein